MQNSGPGSFREALTMAAANGIATDDYIHFNLPGNTLADRTIVIRDELPLISGHLIIDGTTQSGNALGNSSAKILLVADRTSYLSSQYDYGCFNILNVTDVQIYGLAFDQFRSLTTKTNSNGQSSNASGIYIVSSSGITIGAPGRGNVFIQNDVGIYASSDVQHQNTNGKLKVQSNWFGLYLDGTESFQQKSALAHIISKDTEFGGPDPSYGNVLGGFSAYGLSVNGENIKIRFNRFGFDGNGGLSQRVGVTINLSITNGEFSDNLASRFAIEMGSKNVKILRNKELYQVANLFSGGIYFNYSQNIQIGSDDIADVNEFLPSLDGPFRNGGSKNIEIRKNIIHCSAYAYSVRDFATPSIQVLINSDTEYSGTATPNSEVYIYNDYTDCTSCSPLQFYQKLITDASGKWGITGNFTNMKFVANTTLITVSSEFTQPHILAGRSGYWYDKTDASCGMSNGSLSLTNALHLMKVEWYNRKGEKVGEGNKVENLPAGEYYAKGYNGKCYTISPYNASLFNIEPVFVTTNKKIQQPGCGKKNGSIKGLYFNLFGGGAASTKWVDENGETVSAGNVELNNVGPGSYTLIVTTGSNCTKSYGPIKLENTEGPNIDRTSIMIKKANCDNSDGAISGITATGLNNLQYTWKDEKNNIISHNLDLTGAKAGKYILEVKDESACEILTNTFDIASENNIEIDEMLALSSKTTCGKANGSITGIKINGNGTFKWLNENGEVVGTGIELKQVPKGRYKLMVTGPYCTKMSSVFTISEASTKNYISEKKVRNATCNQKNGSISINFGEAPKSLRWIDENNPSVTLSLSSTLTNLGAGIYKLYITDENNCESLYDAYEITSILPPVITERAITIETDKCGLGTGSIKGISISGGSLPYNYTWLDQDNKIVSNKPSLENAFAGKYRLKVVDGEKCEVNSEIYTINTETAMLEAPEVLPVQICAPGNAIIIPAQQKEGKFLLYQTETSSQPLASTTNIFRIQVDKNVTYYVSYTIGICESKRIPVTVEVAEKALKIASSFTPNNDGFNDTWGIGGLENYPEFTLKIFNRMGQNVYSTQDPKFSFNGTQNNGQLPVGVYYFIISLRTGCSNITGSLTLIR
ncbi:gliding motility-associated C-terminal domain-containing protein [Pedobacter zeae]|uniref:Gliding motility-associated-like protein n=1 Tax=Pedobacter zeae TaxID=1737356 RepID=A0A7W6KA93_9SPHI|nr:gliding motility-associated C-terminal domain-containing protein [Pedobacter zeae]MBB4106877.1 gliding motility-associated-like protein [Pedobacter zeae]GGH04301.1 hypothetical protein GCM10007422_19840 [Pedobacter zeae]